MGTLTSHRSHQQLLNTNSAFSPFNEFKDELNLL
jgi:hypothetical protein